MARQAGVKAVESAARASECLRLRSLGYTLDAIAARVGLTIPGVTNAIKYASNRLPKVNALRLRDVEFLKLDQLEAVWLPAAMAGDCKAAVVALKIMERRAKLFGLDAPTKYENTSGEAGAEYLPTEEVMTQIARRLNMFLAADDNPSIDVPVPDAGADQQSPNAGPADGETAPPPVGKRRSAPGENGSTNGNGVH